jgi:hypothetical protein
MSPYRTAAIVPVEAKSPKPIYRVVRVINTDLSSFGGTEHIFKVQRRYWIFWRTVARRLIQSEAVHQANILYSKYLDECNLKIKISRLKTERPLVVWSDSDYKPLPLEEEKSNHKQPSVYKYNPKTNVIDEEDDDDDDDDDWDENEDWDEETNQ